MAVTGTRTGLIRNNGGAMIANGTINSSSPVQQALGRTLALGYHVGAPGSKIYDHADVQTTSGAGGIGYFAAGKYIILGWTTTLAGSANTKISTTGAGNYRRRSINYILLVKTQRAIAAGWDYVTGAFKTTPTVQTDYFGNGNAAPGRDDEAQVTRAVPGAIIYNYGAKGLGTGNDPKRTTYQVKTG